MFEEVLQQNESITKENFNPLKFFPGKPGPQLQHILDTYATGTIGKCIVYFDFEEQQFIVEGKRNSYFRLHDYDTIEETFEKTPNHFLYEHGNGFGYHRQIRPHSNLKMFGGGRFILMQDHLYFFDKSGDFGEAHKAYISHCLGNMPLQGKNYLTESENSSAEFFLIETGLYSTIENAIQYAQENVARAQSKPKIQTLQDQGTSAGRQISLFEEEAKEPDEDLPF